MADKLDELKNILLGDELRRFDTRFMEFGDKLRQLSETAGSGNEETEKIRQYTDEQVSRLEEKLTRLQKDVKTGFEKIIDTVNAQFKKIESDIEKNRGEVETVRRKFDGFKQLFADK
jgi:peptidoglycan hydrolase CwlO-like protein